MYLLILKDSTTPATDYMNLIYVKSLALCYKGSVGQLTNVYKKLWKDEAFIDSIEMPLH